MTFYQPLQLREIFINIFSGSTLIFTFVSIIAIAMGAAYFKMSNSTTLVMLALYGLIMSNWIGNWMIIPIIVIVGVLVYQILAKQWE